MDAKDKRIKALEAEVARLQGQVDVLREMVEGGHVRDSVAEGLRGLTYKQAAVLALVLEGKVYREVAEVFGLSESTVKIMMRNVFVKMGVRNWQEFQGAKGEKVRKMFEMGVVERAMGLPADFGRRPEAYPQVVVDVGTKKHL